MMILYKIYYVPYISYRKYYILHILFYILLYYIGTFICGIILKIMFAFC